MLNGILGLHNLCSEQRIFLKSGLILNDDCRYAHTFQRTDRIYKMLGHSASISIKYDRFGRYFHNIIDGTEARSHVYQLDIRLSFCSGITQRADPHGIKLSCLSILVDNAVKYGAEGGTITLTLEKTDRQARLTVANPGEPIPPENLAHLFERFYRADTSRGEKTGFGLGLSIADTIAREHKGTLKAESDAASTRFIFTMPLKK